MTEEWKNVEGFPNYMISNYGRLYSKTHITVFKDGRRKKFEGQFIKICKSKNGYSIARLSHEGVKKTKCIHRLVADHFINKISGKSEINHKDGNKSNNKIENLEWCTSKENKAHGWQTKLYKPHNNMRGEKHGNCKLSEEQVLKIRKLYDDKKKTLKELSMLFNTPHSTIQKIVYRKTWKELEGDANGKLCRKI